MAASFILTCFACQIYSYALELLRFREAGVEVILKASFVLFPSELYTTKSYVYLLHNLCFNGSGLQEEMGPPVPCFLQLVQTGR